MKEILGGSGKFSFKELKMSKILLMTLKVISTQWKMLKMEFIKKSLGVIKESVQKWKIWQTVNFKLRGFRNASLFCLEFQVL